ncbi:uncharacterized protein LOC112043604 isoform X3 [Bicyclus anynana]|uniref:Uncharacterized protein LOC112043604 isoform X3 n=1 Tax=Bicyclus anynana TaxID=110368 RepID=A0A6J1MHV6_BICAN|nr:uncharacterized protein LOC112043604 isoform X3 [Bicyclus anynana]
MYWSTSKTGAVFVVFLCWVTAFKEYEDDKTLNLKIGFDLTRGKNGAPSLRIRDFEEVPEFRDHKKKRALKSESSSESDENDDGKIIPHIKKAKESDSSDLDTSGSDDDDRRLSTKGILPNEFEPERQPRVHGVNDKGSDTE